ncbi:hypothetical protein M5689_013177 [Euphorbia peplus]|nr:hypothetical protein M5689_013177 [Euphorbia peplus]
MAKLVPCNCKHLLLVAFFLLCFLSSTASARNLRVGKDIVEKKHEDPNSNPNSNAKEQVQEDPNEDLVGMDYTAPKRKPPIHNTMH